MGCCVATAKPQDGCDLPPVNLTLVRDPIEKFFKTNLNFHRMEVIPFITMIY